MKSKSILFGSNNIIRLNGVTNSQDDTLSSGGTCTARLFDDSKDTVLSADEASGQTVLSVEDPQAYEAGVDVLVIQKNAPGLEWFALGVVSLVDVVAGEITVATPTDATIVKGARVCAQIGATISMAAYGTPIANTFDWGYFGTIPAGALRLRIGQSIRAEIFLTDGGIDLTDVRRYGVVGGS